MLAVSLFASGAIGQADPDFGFDFVTIGDLGNRDTTLEETAGPFDYPGVHVGGVDYEYRIATRELTTQEYYEFVVAYFPIFTKNNGASVYPPFSGRWISLTSGFPQIDDPETDLRRPATMGWEYAARYVNWLHNGKVNEEWAFETGVYDTSTFTINDDGTWNHQETHHPNARFWIPSRDEWTKAAYWDPDKDAGKGGYWRFPNTSDIEPIPSLLPENGGERNAGSFVDGWPLDVESFPNVKSPWGLLDMAGGAAEHTETEFLDDYYPQRWWVGSNYFHTSYGSPSSYDILGKGGVRESSDGGLIQGLRLASAVRHPADLNEDWHVNFFDVSKFVELYFASEPSVDFDGDGVLDADDVVVFLELMSMERD